MFEVIVDVLNNRARYVGLGDRIAWAFDFLCSPAAAALEPVTSDGTSTRLDIRGDDVFALVQRYCTKSPQETFWEAHRKHIDVQCVMEGAEMMGWSPLETTQIAKAYDDGKDFVTLSLRDRNAGNYFHISAGMFVIFFPGDAHMPGLSINGVSESVKKLVVKVRV